jgi:glycine cleavage system regulatory protein
VRSAVRAVDAHGLEVRIAPAIEGADAAGEALHFGLIGQDQPGIVNQITAILSGLNANIETFKTWISAEPHSGMALFHMEARLRLPPELRAGRVQAALEEISAEIMVDISLTTAQ